MRNYLPATVASFLVAIALICRMQAQAPEPKPASDRPTREIDLRQFGYERFLRKTTRPLPLFVDFTDTDHVAVGWVKPDVSHAADRTPPLGPEPAHLNVVIFNAKTGQEQSRTDWPTSARYFSAPLFFGIPDGELLICSDNSLRLLSAGMEVVREQELPNHASCLNVTFQYSPSRRTLVVSILSDHTRQMQLLDVETLETLSDWKEEREASAPSNRVRAISDHWLVGYCGKPTELCLRRFDEAWRPFHPIGFDAQMGMQPPALFVSDEILAVGRTATAVVNVRGEVLFQIPSTKKHWLLSPVTSGGGARFAVIEDRLRGLRSQPLDMYPFQADDQAFVYSIKDRRRIFSMELNGTSPWTPWDIHDNFLALSPDGASLAVVSDGILKIYSLPGDSTGQH